jgi:magnesium-transporting ATPase (P-type)
VQVLKYAALSADTHSEEAIDKVMFSCYPQRDSLYDDYDRMNYVPFNPVDKYTIAILNEKRTGKPFRVMKGAPQVQDPYCQSGHRLLNFLTRGYFRCCE